MNIKENYKFKLKIWVLHTEKVGESVASLNS